MRPWALPAQAPSWISGAIIQGLGLPILLGFLWALIPGVLPAALTRLRTEFEDTMLGSALDGYEGYAAGRCSSGARDLVAVDGGPRGDRGDASVERLSCQEPLNSAAPAPTGTSASSKAMLPSDVIR